ncbi:MAG: ATP synthase F1 subunit delta [Actinomycetota bacterium]|nr:ATP synthase F1 subunit delta [Actinomycetota bacterium]
MAAAHRIYAQALYEAAADGGSLATVRDGLTQFVEAAREVPELRQLLRNPRLERDVKRAGIEELMGDSDELLRNFLLLLVEKNRAAEVEEIAREFERIVAAAERILDVELTTAVELSDKEASELLQQIEKASGRRVEATRTVDPDLIGGMVLQAGSLRLDASVLGRLNRLRQELKGRAA